MKSLLIEVSAFFCLGIFLAKFMFLNFWIILPVGIIVFICSCRYKNRIFLAVLFLSIGILCLKNCSILPKSHISKINHKSGCLYYLSGFVESVPERKDNHFEFIFQVKKMQSGNLSRECRGKILVKTDFLKVPCYGDNLTLIGNLSYAGYSNFLKSRDIFLTMRIKDPRQIIFDTGNSGSKLIVFSLWLREKLEAVICLYLKKLPAGILSAMLLGLKKDVPWLIGDSMVKTGTIHILVVSGFNVAIVAFVFNLLFKILRLPRKVRIYLIISCLIFYCAITGASNPVLRATVMAIVLLCAYLFKREPDIYNSLAAAGLFILIFNPRQLFDIGFQLSFCSVLSIVYLFPKLKSLVDLENRRPKLFKFICEGFLVSLSAWAGTFLIIALNFRIISVVTVFANILIVPLASLITLSGFIFLLLGLILPAAGLLFSLPVSFLINLLLTINSAVAKVPFAYFYL